MSARVIAQILTVYKGERDFLKIISQRVSQPNLLITM